MPDRCEGCAEKSDFVALAEENKDTPIKEVPDDPATKAPKAADSKESVDDILGEVWCMVNT